MRSFTSFFVLTFLFLATGWTVQAQTSTDESAIRAIYANMAEGWNNASGEQFAEDFYPESDYLVWNGYYFPNVSQQRLSTSHDDLFKKVYANTDMHYVIDKIRFIKEDIALVHTFAAIVHDGEPMPVNPQVLHSTVVVKENGEWKIISFHNLDLEVYQNEEIRENSPMPPQVMYASWYNAANQ